MAPRDAPGLETVPPRRMNGHAEGPVAEVIFTVCGYRLMLWSARGERVKLCVKRCAVSTRPVCMWLQFRSVRPSGPWMRRPVMLSAGIGVIEGMLGQSLAELEAGWALEAGRRFESISPL